MSTDDSSISIVGAGIVGLMIAYKAIRSNRTQSVVVFDEGPDPRTQPRASHQFGATYSGMDARHMSLTETGPWTSADRVDLIARAAENGGWNCLAGQQLSEGEQAWIDDFRRIARTPDLHGDNYDTVMGINAAGLEAWAELRVELPEVFKPTSDLNVLPIVCASSDELKSEQQAEYELDPHHVTAARASLPDEVALLRPKLNNGTIVGSFLVAGNAYHVRTLCASLLTWLDHHGARFRWNERVDADLDVPSRDVIFAGGVSTRSAELLSRSGMLLQGVVGCWASLRNPGYRHPFKVLGSEPVNFINATPNADSLILSGGYGWVGQRPYEEACRLGQPIAEAFARDVSKFFLDDRGDLGGVETAMCVRPALPSGVPAIQQLEPTSDEHRVFTCVGHAAGGFTQAPAVAERVLGLLQAQVGETKDV